MTFTARSLHDLSEPAPARTSSRATVLVVDDTEAHRYAVARALRSEGFDVLEAATGRLALDIARDASLDAVVLDVHLPDMDGYEVCRNLKAGASGLLPVLHLSATSTSGEARARGLDAGADGYLTHPFDANELRAAVSALVRLKRQEREHVSKAAAASLLQEALDALADHVALLGPRGDVIAVNRSWASFSEANGAPDGPTGTSVNYLDVCERAVGNGADDARAALDGIRAVLAGSTKDYVQEYACHSPTEERWFRMTVRPVLRPGPVSAIVTHTDRTPERLAARAEAAAQTLADTAHRAQAADEAFFRALTERSTEFVAIVDATGLFTYVSPSSERILGYPAAELVGTCPVNLLHEDDRQTAERVFARLVASGDDSLAELNVRMRHRDGSWRYLEAGAQNLLHEPSVRGITSNARDVTARVEAERAQVASEARFRQFVETTHEGVVAMDSAGVITYANPRMESMLSVPRGALLGRPFYEFMPAEEAFASRAELNSPWHSSPSAIETQLQGRDGTVVDVRAAISAIVGDDGDANGTLAVVSDITERMRTDIAMAEALRAADLDRRRLEATLEAIPVGVWLSDADGVLTHVNPAADGLWGGHAPRARSIEDYGQYRAWWPATGAAVEPHQWALSRTLSTHETITNEMMEIERFDGARAFVLNSAAPILDSTGTLTGGVVVQVDVTAHQAQARERERLVASLENERTHLSAVFEQAPSFLAVGRGPTHVFERINPAYQALIGDRDVIGKPVATALPEIVAQGLVERLDHVRATGEAFVARQMPVQLARSGGVLETRYVDLVYQRLEQADGDHAIVAHGVDVTEQVLATELLLSSKQRLHDQFAKLPVPTYLWELREGDFALLECNEAGKVLLPKACHDGTGRTLADIFPGMDDISADMHRCLGDRVVVRRSLQVELGQPAGRRMLDLTMGPQQPDRVLVHVIDTTDRTELEAQLRQAQKMDAVGRLAGGVAHDFNNLLTVIGAHSAFLLESLDSSDPQHEDATAIHKAGVRAAGLTRQLLAFSRKQILKPVVTDINATVEETRKMLERLLGEDIEISTRLAADLPRVIADPTQIDQVVVNLAVNARDAMPAGGRLTITTRATTISERGGAGGIVPAGNYVELTVSDTGVGMDATVQARLFEPFFTTKELGKGTGLGLATVYGIVKQSAGFITVDSTPGEGSAFHVLLPAVVLGEESEQLQEAARASARGVETVLLVEDESAVREVAKRVLRRQGYVVLEAANGDSALAISRAYAASIHLIVTDAVMPGMGGAEVVRTLQAQRPGMKALFMSGYTDDEIVRRGIVSSSFPFVQKPFTPQDFSRAVRKALDA